LPQQFRYLGLAHIVLGNDLEAAVAYVLMLRDRGLDMDTLFIELLEPAARHLGTCGTTMNAISSM